MDTVEGTEAGHDNNNGKPTIESVLAPFDEAFTLVATAASAIECALDSTVVEDCAEPSEKVKCLVRGVKGLRRGRIEIETELFKLGLR